MSETRSIEVDFDDVEITKFDSEDSFYIEVKLIQHDTHICKNLLYQKKHIRDSKFENFNEKQLRKIKNELSNIALKHRESEEIE